MKKMIDYFDQYGLLTNGGLTGSGLGDSARETGTYICALESATAKSLVWEALSKCITDEGLVRHPHGEGWVADPKLCSADQFVAVMCALITLPTFLDREYWVRRLIPFNFLLAQNKDIMIYETFSLYIRALRMWYLYPLIVFWDVGLFVNAWIRVVKSYVKPSDTADDINVATMCVVFSQVYPTPFIYLACWVYKLRKGGVLSAWESYYKRDVAPPMTDLWAPILKKYLN